MCIRDSPCGKLYVLILSDLSPGDRSERIRTYNFPQGRVTDHRINLTLHKLDKVLQGEALDELIDALIVEDRMLKLEING